MSERRKIRWLIAHYPAYLFVRTAEVFNKKLEELCPGQFEVEIHTLESYVEKYNKLHDLLLVPPEIPSLEEPSINHPEFAGREVQHISEIKSKWQTIFNAMKNGDIEMSQTQINIIGMYLNWNYNAIDLPFLFNDHDHVARVLDGKIGDELGERLARESDIRGLGFTYSGGYRVIGSNKEIKDISDLANTTFLTTTKASNIMFNELGVAPLDKGEIGPADHGDIQKEGGAIETTYLRFTGKHVLKTDHSMFMTSILTSNGFFDSLTPEQQEAFKVAAKSVAQTERIWSVEDAAKYEQDAEVNGVKIVEISEEDRNKLKHAAKQSYKSIVKMKIDPKLVNDILKAGKK